MDSKPADGGTKVAYGEGIFYSAAMLEVRLPSQTSVFVIYTLTFMVNVTTEDLLLLVASEQNSLR